MHRPRSERLIHRRADSAVDQGMHLDRVKRIHVAVWANPKADDLICRRRATSCRLSSDDFLLFIVRCIDPAYPRDSITGEDRFAQLLQTFVNLSAHGLLDLAA